MKIQAITAAALFAVVASSNLQAAPAAVINDLGCSGFVPNPDTEDGLPALAFLSTDSSHSVVTNSKKGNTVLTCKFDHDVDLKGASGAQGFPCGTPGGATNNSMMIASPGGKATLVCKINGSND